MTDDDRTYTDAERDILEQVVASHGEEWVDEHAELLLAQARLIGEL